MAETVPFGAGHRTGSVFLEDYDVGLAETMGGELITIVLDGEEVQTYALRVTGVTGPPQYDGMIPILMGEPDPVYQEHLLPAVVVSRGSIDPDMQRWHAGGFEYFLAAPGATMKDVPGTGRQIPDKVEIKRYAYPYNISYDLHIRARHRSQADKMLRKVGKHFWAYGQVFLKDSEGCDRGYYAFVESIAALNEIVDVTDRLQGHTFSLRVEAELDFREPSIARTAQTVTVNVNTRRNVGSNVRYKGNPFRGEEEDC